MVERAPILVFDAARHPLGVSSRPVTEAPRIEYSDETCMIATWRSFAFPVFGHRPPTVAGVQALGRGLEAHGRKMGASSLFEITLIDEHSVMPEADVRSALEAMVPKVSPYYACAVAVYEGAGFRAAMIRGILTSFQLISRHKYPQKVFASIDECAGFVAPLAKTTKKVDVDVAEAVAAIRAVREQAVVRDVFSKPVS